MAIAGGRSVRWLFNLVRPQSARVLVVLAASGLASALSLAPPWLTRFLIDDGLIGRRIDLVAWYCAAILGAAVAAALVGAFNRWQYLTLSSRVLFGLREAVFAHLQSLPPTFFSGRSTGDVMARLDGDVAEVQRFAVDTLLAAVNSVLVLAGTLAAMAALCPSLLLPAFILLPVQVAITRLMRARIGILTRKVRERSTQLTAFLVETIGAMKLVQAVGAAPREQARLVQLNRYFLGDLRRAEMAGFAVGAIPSLLNGVAAGIVFLIGGTFVMKGSLSVGALIAFVSYLGRAGGPVNTFLGLIIAQRRAAVSLDRLAEILDEPPAVMNPAEPRRLPSEAKGEIVLDGVHFAYPGCPSLFSDVQAILPAGVKVGIVGASGAGKSTLIDLLHRHYDPEAGRILLDGCDLRSLDLTQLRRRIAVVAQDSPLISGTIAANILYAAPDASAEEVIRAAVAAEIAHLGLDTPVAERGASLSGGERQRLAIARALLQDPLVLILDEATSAIDRETEQRIARTIDRLFANRTRIIISHHAEVLADADRILELTPTGFAERRIGSAA